MMTRTLILELNEDDEPEAVEGFNACVGAIHELIGQTMYNCRESNPDIVASYPQGLDKIRQAPKELAELMQEYVCDRGALELNIHDSKVAELFNDFLLFVNGGIDPPLEVYNPSEGPNIARHINTGDRPVKTD